MKLIHLNGQLQVVSPGTTCYDVALTMMKPSISQQYLITLPQKVMQAII